MRLNKIHEKCKRHGWNHLPFLFRIISLKTHYSLNISSLKIGYIFQDIHLFNKMLLSAKKLRDMVVGAGDTMRTQRWTCPPAASIQGQSWTSTLAIELECDQENSIFRETWQTPP